MTTCSRVYPKLYKDSVSLMIVSAKISAMKDIVSASVVMASATNIENLAQAGLGSFEVSPNDLIVAVAGSENACEQALQLADDLLLAKSDAAAPDTSGGSIEATSIQMAVAQDPARNFVLISVPGDYAAAEAMKALRLGLNVMVFSDNVTLDRELDIKSYARDHGLMVMGPDCGTAIVNGVPLGFANIVRRGPIGVVGASGTGTQEVTARIHQLGSGVSQAFGTGSHDLSTKIGGISMLHGLAALQEDRGTEVIVLVSKPPAHEIAQKVIGAARMAMKPVVVAFLGADPTSIAGKEVFAAQYLAEAADMAVALARGGKAATRPLEISGEMRAKLHALASGMASSQRYVRGVYSGGTFCYEAQLIYAAVDIPVFSNAPSASNRALPDNRKSVENTIVDMGDDEFTQGRPHPMIDPSQRDARIRDEASDPSTAVVLFDVVLGYGSAADPTAGLLGVISSARTRAKSAGRSVVFIGHVCGTDKDPQDRSKVTASLRSANVVVASSNAEAAAWSAEIIRFRAGERL